MNTLTKYAAPSEPNGTITMSSLEMEEFINASPGTNEAPLRNDNLMAKVPQVLGVLWLVSRTGAPRYAPMMVRPSKRQQQERGQGTHGQRDTTTTDCSRLRHRVHA